MALEGARSRLTSITRSRRRPRSASTTTIDVQRFQALVSHRISRWAEASLRGTVFLNKLDSQTSRVTRIEAEFKGPITRRVLFSIGYSTDLLRGDLYRGAAFDLAFTRNVVSIGLTLIPWRTR